MDESKYKYNSWPLGKVPKELQRPELDIIKNLGYDWKDARDVIDIFENKVAKFAGSKYAITTDCCSNGVFLCLKYLQSIGELKKDSVIKIPNRTYASIPMQIKHANLNVEFEDLEWSGMYNLKNTRVWDGAVRWTKEMYIGDNSFQVVSFQFKKRIPIGKGGIILTDDADAAKWLKLASYDGRDLTIPYDDPNHISVLGYHMYMTPEDAARGIILMDSVNKESEIHPDSGNHSMYPDLSKLNLFDNSTYEIFDAVSYEHMGELQPFTLIKKCSSKEEMEKILLESKQVLFAVNKNTNKLYNNFDKFYGK
jgi:hypothetical protein